MSERAPVLMMGFNRPELTRALLSRVRKALPQKVYFAVDGARKDRIGELELVRQVQAISKEIDWPCEVRTLFRDRNLGCAKAIPDAISWVFGYEKKCIILEDDCQPTEGFFSYENEMLERYENDDRIGIVSGFNHYNYQTDQQSSYHFTKRTDIWGWGTWARVWKNYSLDVMKYLPELENILVRWSNNHRMRSMMRSYVNSVIDNPTTWDVQLSLCMMALGFLNVAPRRRMVLNCGFGDDRGTHTAGYCYDAVYYEDVWEGDREIVHPAEGVKGDIIADDLTERRMVGLLPRGLTFVGSKFPMFRTFLNCCGKRCESVFPWAFRI